MVLRVTGSVFNKMVINWLKGFINFSNNLNKNHKGFSLFDVYNGLCFKHVFPIFLFRSITNTKKYCGIDTVNYLFVRFSKNYCIPIFNITTNIHSNEDGFSKIKLCGGNGYNTMLKKRFVARLKKYYSSGLNSEIKKVLFKKSNDECIYIGMLFAMSFIHDEDFINRTFGTNFKTGDFIKFNHSLLHMLSRFVDMEKLKNLSPELQDVLINNFTPYSVFLLLSSGDTVFLGDEFIPVVYVPLYVNGEFIIMRTYLTKNHVDKLIKMASSKTLMQAFDFIGSEFIKFVNGDSKFMFLLTDGKSEVIKQLISTYVKIDLGSFIVKFSLTPTDKVVMQVYRKVFGASSLKYKDIFGNHQPLLQLVYVKELGKLRDGAGFERMKTLSYNGNGCVCFDESNIYIYNPPKYAVLLDKDLSKYVRVIPFNSVESLIVDTVNLGKITINYIDGNSEVIKQNSYFIGNYNEFFKRENFFQS